MKYTDFRNEFGLIFKNIESEEFMNFLPEVMKTQK